jgi:tetratricopeptide (TPR) repeat protein
VSTHILTAVFALGVIVGPAAAQAPLLSPRAAAAMPKFYGEPLCRLEGGHRKITDAVTHLRNALAFERHDDRASELAEGKRRVLEAITNHRRDESSAAWYTLAQIYLYQGDVLGADSALRLTEAISPKCAASIEALRYTVWAPLLNAGAEFSKAGADDSALALFRQAAAIFPEQPQAALNAGVVFANGGRPDSAAVYFARAAAAAERRGLAEERKQATYNLAAMLQRTGRHQQAAAELERYLAWEPGDENAKRALAVSYRGAGRTEEARTLEVEVGASPAAAPDDAVRAAVNLYEEEKYAEAAEAFRRALADAPFNRDAVYGLAVTYQALEDGPKLVETAVRLVAIEPLNPDAFRLLGSGYRQTKQTRELLDAATHLVVMPSSVAVQDFVTAADSVSLTATATGRAAQTAAGKPLPPEEVTVVFEFVDSLGNVVASREVLIPALKREQTAPLTVHAQGKGITAWRYRRKEPAGG